jgi:integrase
VRQAVEGILDKAGADGLRKGDNPARWHGNLDLSLPKPKKVTKVEHRPSLAYDEMHAFWQDLTSKDTVAAKALQLQILTAVRPGEARGAMWREIDLSKKLWTIPGERMKEGIEHTVPLTAEAVKLLEALPRTGDHVFPNRNGKPISDAMPTRVIGDLHDKKEGGYVDHRQGDKIITAHGFRSTFTDWAAECTRHENFVIKMAKAQKAQGVEEAYRRGDLLEKRRRLMNDWARFILKGEAQGKVVPMKAKA